MGRERNPVAYLESSAHVCPRKTLTCITFLDTRGVSYVPIAPSRGGH